MAPPPKIWNTHPMCRSDFLFPPEDWEMNEQGDCYECYPFKHGHPTPGLVFSVIKNPEGRWKWAAFDPEFDDDRPGSGEGRFGCSDYNESLETYATAEEAYKQLAACNDRCWTADESGRNGCLFDNTLRLILSEQHFGDVTDERTS